MGVRGINFGGARRRPADTKTAHVRRQILKTLDFENGTLSGTFRKRYSVKHLQMIKMEHVSMILERH